MVWGSSAFAVAAAVKPGARSKMAYHRSRSRGVRTRTNEEKDLLIAYLIDAGDIDPDGDVEAQFLDWYQVRDAQVSGETHYKALLQAARVRKRNFEEGRRAGRAEAGAKMGWDQLETAPGLHRFMDHARGAED